MRFKLLIEYAGTRYSGWQIQKNARTVQGEIDRAVRELSGRRDFELYGSGRTDAGVHALAQVAHLDLQTTLSAEDVMAGVNDRLPADINILAVARVPHRFHARHDAVGRSYLYQIARRRTAFAKPYVWWVKEDLDLANMRAAAARFAGMHDFQAFTDADPDDTSTAVQIERVQIEDTDDLLLVRVEGSHFLWKMVRRMIGVLVEVARGGLATDVIGELTEVGGRPTTRSRSLATGGGTPLRSSKVPARLTAPASGLFLERVFYPGDRRDYPIGPALFALRRPD